MARALLLSLLMKEMSKDCPIINCGKSDGHTGDCFPPYEHLPPVVTSEKDRPEYSSRTLRVSGVSSEFGPYEFELTLGYATSKHNGPIGHGPIFVALDNEVIPAIRKALS